MAETHYIHLGRMLHPIADEKPMASQTLNLVTCRLCLAMLERARKGGVRGQ